MAPVPATNDARLTTRALLGAVLAGVTAVALAGCGSASVGELPPAAAPDTSPRAAEAIAGRVIAPDDKPLGADLDVDTTSSTFRDGSLTATVHARARTLTITDTATGKVVATKPAGVGPTHVACYPTGPCYVVDTEGDALLVFRVGEGGRDLRLSRRVYVAGAPYGIALDAERSRLWVTLTARNEVVELPSHGRPHILQRLATLQQPDAVAVDETSGDVLIAPPDRSQLQLIPDPTSGD